MAENDFFDTPSSLYRQQIANLAKYMNRLVTHTVKFPLRVGAMAFGRISSHFNDAEDTAYLCCSVLDTAQSIDGEERAVKATTAVMTQLVNLKNEAGTLIDQNVHENAVFLDEVQKNQSSNLHAVLERSVSILEHLQGKELAEFENSHPRSENVDQDTHIRAKDALLSSHRNAADILKQSHSEALNALNSSHSEATSALQESYDRSAETYTEKDQVISWLTGAYSVEKKRKLQG